MFDAERQIRFLYPPVFFVASLLLGLRFDSDTRPADVVWILFGEEVQHALFWNRTIDGSLILTGAAASGLVVFVAAGFLISSISVLVLRLAFALIDGRPYEAALDLSSYDSIRTYLIPSGSQLRLPFETRSKRFWRGMRERLGRRQWLYVPRAHSPAPDAVYLSATLDHEVINDRVHKWVFRRWSMFYIASNSATAILLALPVGLAIDITSLAWLYWSIGGAALLSCVAVFAWHDTMGMLNFQARRDLKSLGAKSLGETDAEGV